MTTLYRSAIGSPIIGTGVVKDIIPNKTSSAVTKSRAMVCDISKDVVDHSNILDLVDAQPPGSAVSENVIAEGDIGNVVIIGSFAHEPLVEIVTNIAVDGYVMSVFAVVVEGLETIDVRIADLIEQRAVEEVVADEVVVAEET